jgi:hypothetical protein
MGVTHRSAVVSWLVSALALLAPSTAPAAAPESPPLRLVEDRPFIWVGGDARRYVFYQRDADSVTVLDAWRQRSTRFTFEQEGCHLPDDDDRTSAAFGHALVRCYRGATELPSRILNLRTGAVTEPPSRFVVQDHEVQVTYAWIGRYWLAGKVACGRPGGCRALYNLRTGERRLVPRGDRPLDLDSERARPLDACAPFEPLPLLREARETARIDEGGYLVKGSGHKSFDRLVLARCGGREISLDRRNFGYSEDFGITLAQGVVTWTIYKGAYAYDVRTGRRFRWLFSSRSVPGYLVQTREEVFLPSGKGLFAARLS